MAFFFYPLSGGVVDRLEHVLYCASQSIRRTPPYFVSLKHIFFILASFDELLYFIDFLVKIGSLEVDYFVSRQHLFVACFHEFGDLLVILDEPYVKLLLS